MTSTISVELFGSGDHPRDLTAEDFALMTGGGQDGSAAAGGSVPTMAPPQAGVGQNVGDVSGQKVVALWANAADRNAWLYLATDGWKKLSTLSDSGSGNLAKLAASARESGSAPYVVTDASGLVSALYVW